ncbi:MAG: mechanosensitive ion channel domain-containing protein [Ignavibacteria bacterium]
MTEFIHSVTDPVNHLLSAFLNSIPNLIVILIVVVITRYFVKLIKFIVEKLETDKNGTKRDWVIPVYKVIRFFVFVYMFMIIFPYIPGSGKPVFQGLIILIGLFLSVGSASFMSNIFSGLAIAYSNPFKTGDRIKVGDITGDITEKRLLTTKIRTIKNEDVFIPNSLIMSKGILNFSSSAKSLGLIVHSSVTISYDVPWKTVHTLLIESAKATKGILETPEPFVLQKSLDDFYVSYEINAYTEKPNLQASIYSELHQNIQNKFNSNSIDLITPYFNVTAP